MLVRSSSRFRDVRVALRLAQRAHTLRHHEPATMLGKLELALEITRQTIQVPVQLAADVRAEILARLGNAHRVLGNLVGAAEALQSARGEAEVGSADPMIAAQIERFQGALEVARGNLAGSLPCFRAAWAIYAAIGDDHRAARVLVSLGRSYGLAGDLDESVRCTCVALRLMDTSIDPDLPHVAALSLAHFLSDGGYSRQSLELVRRARVLPGPQPGATLRLRLDWMEGRILGDLGRNPEAIALLEVTRCALLGSGLLLDAAEISLDLALLFLGEGCADKAARLTREMYPIFVSKELSKEASAALLLFASAAQKGVADASLLLQIRARIRSLRVP